MDYKEVRRLAIADTKKKLSESVKFDTLIIQAINNIAETDKVLNTYYKRLREWYEWYSPEVSRSIENQEQFVKFISEKSKEELRSQFKIQDEMGGKITDEDIEAITTLANEIKSLWKYKDYQSKYIENTMQKNCPNMAIVATPLVGAKLISAAGSLYNLMKLPASTIQLLGAEKALFRHLRTGARSPKHGLILQHSIVSQSKNKGKAARLVADKIAICSKIDYFHGEFIGDKILEDIRGKVK